MAQTENKTPKMALKEAGMGKYVTGDSESPQKSLLPLPRLNSTTSIDWGTRAQSHAGHTAPQN